MTTATRVIQVAESQLGYIEKAGNRTRYGAWYGLDGNPWCDMFMSWVFDQAGAGAIGGKFAYTPSHALWFMRRGQWGDIPRVGAAVFFRFSGNRIHHCGIVTAIRNGYIETIEGNTDEAGGRTGGKVMRRARKVGIVGYGYLAYDSTTDPPLPPPIDYGDEMSHPFKVKLGNLGAGEVFLPGLDATRFQGATFNTQDTRGKAQDDDARVEVPKVGRCAAQENGVHGTLLTLTNGEPGITFVGLAWFVEED